MKGKLILVAGFAAGYVLGARAGRTRYNQIKKGAQAVWGTPAVQAGVDKAQEFTGARVEDVRDLAVDFVGDLIKSKKSGSKSSSTTAKSSGTKSSASKTSGAKSTSAKSSSTTKSTAK